MQTEWERWTCIHGVTEELDYHPCNECQTLAKKLGYDFSDKHQTYIFTRQIVNRLKRKKKYKEILKDL